MVLGRKTNFFLGKRWFWAENQLFPGKKMVLGKKNNFFLGKRWFWAEKNQLFPRKKMVLGRKTNFFLGKTKKTIFLEFGRIVSQKMVFFGVFGFS